MFFDDYSQHSDISGQREEERWEVLTDIAREQERELEELIELESPRSACSTDQQLQREFLWSSRYSELESEHREAFLPAKSSSSSSSVWSILVILSGFVQSLSRRISSVAKTGCPYARFVSATFQYIFQQLGKPFARRPNDKDFFLFLLACLLACLLVCVSRVARSNVEVVVVVVVVRC